MLNSEQQEQWERQYRILYWQKNELDLIGAETPSIFQMDEYKNIVWQMENLIEWLGYTPAP